MSLLYKKSKNVKELLPKDFKVSNLDEFPENHDVNRNQNIKNIVRNF